MSTTTTTNTKEKKVTKTQRFQDIRAMLCGEKVKYNTDTITAIEFINHEIELLEKKNNTGKQAEKKTVDTGYKELILNHLSEVETANNNNEEEIPFNGLTCTEIGKNIIELAELNNQKIAALVRSLEKDNKLERTIIKGRAYFKLK